MSWYRGAHLAHPNRRLLARRLQCRGSPATDGRIDFLPLSVVAFTTSERSDFRIRRTLGIGWFAQEYDAAGIDFPSVGQRYAHLEDALQVLPMLWGKGSPRFEGATVTIDETLCYPRPVQPRIPIVVGGSGERRTLRLAARYADGCNLFGEPDVVARKVAVLGSHCNDIGRDVNEVGVSHLSTVLIGSDHDEVAASVERLRPKRRQNPRPMAIRFWSSSTRTP